MLDQTFEYRDLWTEFYENNDLEALRIEVANSSHDHRAIGVALIKEFEEKERYTATLKRDEELKRLAVETLDTQRDGNEIQKKILRVLVATLALTFLIAIF